ncbi:MAG TPA: ion channel, partial [Nitrososphaera sp.]|nr:ion channel [Nitrososphaera sp.]
SPWLIVLFGLPPFMGLLSSIGLYTKHDPEKYDENVHTIHFFCGLTMFLNIFFYCLMWAIYTNVHQHNYLSYVALLFIAIMLLIVVAVTYLIMRPTGSGPEEGAKNPGVSGSHSNQPAKTAISDWMTRMKIGLMQVPFSALLHFFAIFLGVTYLFGFAFAFHDRSKLDESNGNPYYKERPPLYSAMLPFRSKAEQAASNTSEPGPCFYFDTKSAFLEKAPPKDIKDTNPSDVIAVMRRKRINYNSIEQIVTRVKSLPPANLIRLTLIGRADERSTNQDSYLSNYELSQARTLMVKDEILKALLLSEYNNWRNIEWVLLPLSNEQASRAFPQRETSCLEPLNSKDQKDNDRVVESTIEAVSNDPTSFHMQQLQAPEVQPLDLMDYMYFSIYTITTTGYGDIIPTTAYAKFLTALANIFEVFFIVGFFNVLISLKEDKK